RESCPSPAKQSMMMAWMSAGPLVELAEVLATLMVMSEDELGASIFATAIVEASTCLHVFGPAECDFALVFASELAPAAPGTAAKARQTATATAGSATLANFDIGISLSRSRWAQPNRQATPGRRNGDVVGGPRHAN